MDIPVCTALATQRAALGQYDTQRWVAEAVVERCGLTQWSSGVVIEPACGTGAFLHAIPDVLTAIGIEIDARRAAHAATSTGRPVLVGDFRTLPLPIPDSSAQCLIGNPPFNSDLVQAFMRRAYTLLEPQGFACFILPAYIFQTSSKVEAYRREWSIYQDLMPRNLFPNLKLPLVLARFVKDGRRLLHGFFLYEETVDFQSMTEDARRALQHSDARGSVWRAAVFKAIRNLGGRARLGEIYQEIEPRRPTGNPWWKEQIRKTLLKDAFFRREGDYWRCMELDRVTGG